MLQSSMVGLGRDERIEARRARWRSCFVRRVADDVPEHLDLAHQPKRRAAIDAEHPGDVRRGPRSVRQGLERRERTPYRARARAQTEGRRRCRQIRVGAWSCLEASARIERDRSRVLLPVQHGASGDRLSLDTATGGTILRPTRSFGGTMLRLAQRPRVAAAGSRPRGGSPDGNEQLGPARERGHRRREPRAGRPRWRGHPRPGQADRST